MQNENITFEATMEELDGIVRALEEGNIPLADMVELYEKGTLLGKECLKMLENYEGRVTMMKQGEGEEA